MAGESTMGIRNFNTVEKKIFLGRKNIGGAFAPPPPTPNYAYG
jgi:hypothetical protein